MGEGGSSVLFEAKAKRVSAQPSGTYATVPERCLREGRNKAEKSDQRGGERRGPAQDRKGPGRIGGQDQDPGPRTNARATLGSSSLQASNAECAREKLGLA